MQNFIDFLVNNYLWFIIIALILVFALIGYLVDTSEKKTKEENMDGDLSLEAPTIENNHFEKIESANMNTDSEEMQELEKDVIVMSDDFSQDSNQTITISDDETELL